MLDFHLERKTFFLRFFSIMLNLERLGLRHRRNYVQLYKQAGSNWSTSIETSLEYQCAPRDTKQPLCKAG